MVSKALENLLLDFEWTVDEALRHLYQACKGDGCFPQVEADVLSIKRWVEPALSRLPYQDGNVNEEIRALLLDLQQEGERALDHFYRISQESCCIHKLEINLLLPRLQPQAKERAA